MKKILHTALLSLIAVSAACQPVPAVPVTAESASESQPAGATMDFELASLAGGVLSPLDLGEDLILIDFWATWCGPCHLQADILAKLYPELKSKGVEFLAVSLGEPESVVREFVADRPFAYPVLVDPSDFISSNYGIFVLPTVVILDREGTIMYLHEGISSAGRLISAIDEVLGNRAAPEPGSNRRTARDNEAEEERAVS